ncbi:hypothetical protein ILUMI_22958 [Ignelater luminosus]|uniref:Uncharacterized protein n=1 Tax=Ignelater luminosus TaxID=2038154 RepID=A0A8K0G243_IGNLU|nr:hypothetical protein ILUMI_22958 [Ignelater luminosus]
MRLPPSDRKDSLLEGSVDLMKLLFAKDDIKLGRFLVNQKAATMKLNPLLRNQYGERNLVTMKNTPLNLKMKMRVDHLLQTSTRVFSFRLLFHVYWSRTVRSNGGKGLIGTLLHLKESQQTSTVYKRGTRNMDMCPALHVDYETASYSAILE